MELRQTYVFFLILTTVGAFVTIKICTTAYAVYDYSDNAPVPVHHASLIPKTNLDNEN